jgi:alpha-L-rhamnosidase
MPSHPFVNRAQWIWSAEGSHAVPAPAAASPSHYQVRRFRRRFRLFRVPESLPVFVTADSRYLLFCNGRLVSRGPAKGDVNHHFFDLVDLAPHLQPGENVLAALVLDMSRVAHRPALLGAPCSVMTYAGGFLLEGEVEGADGMIHRLDTGEPGWRVTIDRAHRFQNEGTTFEGYHGYFEHRVDRELPEGWTELGFDEADWPEATVLYRAERLEDRRDPTSPYGLLPRLIPALAEEPPRRFATGFRPGGGEPDEAWQQWLAGRGEVVLPARSRAAVILDVGELTTAYPRLAVRGGGGAQLRLTYAEALRLPWDTPGAKLLGKQQSLANLASHFADEQTGWTFDRRGAIRGWSDRWEPRGGPHASIFEPLHWRAFRYAGLEIEVGEEPLTLLEAGYRFTAYPFTFASDFACSDPQWERIWQMGLRTAQLCSHETFEDCPHYEQMQYAGDTMITSKIVMLTTGDYRLTRQALYHFDWSRLSDGLTQSRYPSRLVQIIPSWSLHWITTIRDFAYCSGDLVTVGDLLPGVRSVLDWFRRHADDRGLPARLPYWNITDWCPWWPRGVVPGADTGPTCIISAQYIVALDEAADLARLVGDQGTARAWLTEATHLRRQLHDTFWSDREGLYVDRPGGSEISQYGNAWAILAGAADEATRQRLLARFPHDPKLAPGSFFCWHAVFRALALAGDYRRMPEFLAPWHASAATGLDTFVEENSYWRSLCHAWSAHPVLELLQRVLGIIPARPGFTEITIAPHSVGLDFARGSVCTPRGPVRVHWQRAAGERIRLEVEAPAGVPVSILSRGGELHRFDGGHWKGEIE